MSARRRFRGWLWDEGGAVKVYAVIYDPPDRHGPFVHWYRRKSDAKGHKRGDPQHLIALEKFMCRPAEKNFYAGFRQRSHILNVIDG
jgi:hypothetical protein